MKRSVIIVAGGSGARMGSSVPKQFLLLKGKPVLFHTIDAFKLFDTSIEIILVLPESQISTWNQLCSKYNYVQDTKIVKGGESRFHSVKNGLEAVTSTHIVAIHDGVRPLVSQETIARCFSCAEEKGNAVPVIPIDDSIREIYQSRNRAVDRTQFVSVQTPQCFSVSLLKKGFQQPFHPNFTDDASVIEALGETLNLVEGNKENIKITRPLDIKIAEVLVSL